MGVSVSKDVERLLKAAGIGRFQVMALLQAARYYLLYGDTDKAKSFGLNRAIFYAWAKHYGPRYRVYHTSIEELLKRARRKPGQKCPEGFVEVAGECVQVSPRGYYMIGGEEQTPRDFDREVAWRINRVIGWDRAWKAALEYVSQFPEWVLKDQQRFYKLVYEPVRDVFLKMVAEGKTPKPPKEIIDRIRSLEEALKKAKRQQVSLDRFMGGS